MYIGNEPLSVGGHDIALTVNDFWRWSFSDFSDFSTRDAFSKFLVASSLGLTADGNARQRRVRNLLWSPAGSAGIRISVRTEKVIISAEMIIVSIFCCYLNARFCFYCPAAKILFATRPVPRPRYSENFSSFYLIPIIFYLGKSWLEFDKNLGRIW